MMRLRPRHVRTRLTLWYVTVLAGVLLVYGASASTVLLLQLRGQLDRLAIQDLETIEGFLSFRPDGTVLLRTAEHDHPYPGNLEARMVEVWSDAGALLYRNEVLGNRALGGPPTAAEGVRSYSQRSVRLSDGTRVRLVSKRHNLDGRPTLIRLGFSERDLWQRFWQLLIGLGAGLPLALGLAGVAGYFLARRALSPVERMASRAHEINVERLGSRLDVENPDDELGRLALAFNETLARLERSFEQLRQFTADASHELRTPLTALRSVGEVGLRTSGSGEQYREVIGSMLEEAGRLGHLVDCLLTVARADSGQIRIERAAIDIRTLAGEAVSLLQVLAEEKSQKLSLDGEDSAQVHADRAILRQVLVNLLDNAIKYSPPGGTIRVRVSRVNDRDVAVEVEDNGPGIPEEHRDRVFDRFYRVDDARSREAGGAGLGLAIAKWGAEIHGGSLELESAAGSGCIFRLRLPILRSAASDPEAAFRKPSGNLQWTSPSHIDISELRT